jgi:hypothetical protein
MDYANSVLSMMVLAVAVLWMVYGALSRDIGGRARATESRRQAADQPPMSEQHLRESRRSDSLRSDEGLDPAMLMALGFLIGYGYGAEHDFEDAAGLTADSRDMDA